MWWFCLLYSVTFGGYVGLSSFMPLFLRDQYVLTPAAAGSITALAAFVGSGIRPIGGYLADRVGGVRLLSAVLAGIGATCALGSTLPAPDVMTPVLVVAMACLGLGNGAVFKAVPRDFPDSTGAATGIVGAAGGLGGFFPPVVMGIVKDHFDTYALGFVGLLAFTVICLIVALSMRRAAQLPQGAPA